MVPFLFLLMAVIVLRGLGTLGIRALKSWRACVRLGLSITFTFTGLTHFSRMRHDYAAMIPPPFPPALGLIYLTGLAEIALGTGLLVPRLRRTAAWGLMALLIGLFPANVYAWMEGIPFGGRPPTDLLPRALIQAAFLLSVWWSSLRPGRGSVSAPLGEKSGPA